VGWGGAGREGCGAVRVRPFHNQTRRFVESTSAFHRPPCLYAFRAAGVAAHGGPSTAEKERAVLAAIGDPSGRRATPTRTE
jgi:hypothetical protein